MTYEIVRIRSQLANYCMQASKEKLLKKMLSLIRKNPGIRPKELHQLLNLEHSWNLRSTLIKRGLVKKERDGLGTRYYPTKARR